jgi:hypothetical protein
VATLWPPFFQRKVHVRVVGTKWKVRHVQNARLRPLQHCRDEPRHPARSSPCNGLLTPRRFPPPWTVEDHNDACFIVKDNSGFAVAYVYYEEEPGRRSATNLMTKDEARRIAANIAKLPELLSSR